MKKVVLFNLIQSLFYFFLEFSFPLFFDWTEQISSGAERILEKGILIVGILVVLLGCGSMIYSIINSILKKKMVKLLPILILLVSGIFCVLIFNHDSFWVKVIEYYKHF